MGKALPKYLPRKDFPKYGLGDWLAGDDKNATSQQKEKGISNMIWTGAMTGGLGIVADLATKGKFGDFMGSNAKTVGTLGGAAVGTALGGNTAAGAAIGGAVGGFVQNTNQQLDQSQQQQQQATQFKNQNLANNLAGQQTSQANYNPVFCYGGKLSMGGKLYPVGGKLMQYSGQTHEGADGGIEVDKSGNPTAMSGDKPVGLVEDKEVAWKSPSDEVFIFSDRLGFANKAKREMNKLKMRPDDVISKTGLTKNLTKLADEQEQFKASQGIDNDAAEHAQGGYLSGKEYEVDDNEIKKLEKLGYKFDLIK